MIFEAVDKLMPKEGVDYNLHVTFSGSKFMLRFEGLTDLGKAFAMHCQANVNAVITALQKERGGKKDDPDGGKVKQLHEAGGDKAGAAGAAKPADPGPDRKPEEKHVSGSVAADVRPNDTGSDLPATPGAESARPVS